MTHTKRSRHTSRVTFTRSHASRIDHTSQMSYIWVSHVTHEWVMAHTNQSRHTSRVTCTQLQWLQLVGSLKLQGSFAKEPCKRDYILQKRPIILRRLQISHVTHYESRAHNCTRLAYIAGRVYHTYEWVMSHMNESWNTQIRHVTHHASPSHDCMRLAYIIHVSESCHI